MICGIDTNNIPSAEIKTSEIPAKTVEYNDELIKFSNITAKTPYDTVRNFTTIDVETTGLSAEKAEIIEVCAIKFRDGLPTEKFTTLTSPTKKITARITKINGITNDMVEDCPHFSLIADSLIDFIGSDNIVGHNLEFDIRFLLQHGADVTKTKRKYFDTLTLAQHILKKPGKKWNPDLEEYEDNYDDYDVENYRLSTLCEYYHISLTNAHRATGDSYAAGLLFLELADERTSHPYAYNKKQTKIVDPKVEDKANLRGITIPFEIFGFDSLKTLTDREYFQWVKQFTEWGQSLPKNISVITGMNIQKQLDIIKEETTRREKAKENGQKLFKIVVFCGLICIILCISIIVFAK